MGDEVVVEAPGLCIHGRYGVFTGQRKAQANRGRWFLSEVYEIDLFSGELETLWLPPEMLVWL